ncbi:MAG: response regulator transcription factor, partial [Actinomycetota bacterium]
MIRVVLVDDQELVRSGLRRILATTDDVEVVAECSDGDEVQTAVWEHSPDVVVMDIRMKRMDGVEATKRLREREGSPPVLVLTTFDDDELLSAALRAGAAGF